MMFSLNVNSIRDVLKRKGKQALNIVDLPRYTYEHLGLNALNLSTDLLKGMGQTEIERIRDNGDKVGCTCLMLAEPESIPLGDIKGKLGDLGVERMGRVIKAASLLGCNAVSLSISGKDNEQSFELATMRMKQILEYADKIDINVLISPMKGITEDADRVTELVKAIGGFRIGTLPDFATAFDSGDPVNYLRRLTPYATVVNASTLGFETPEHDDSLDNVDGLVGLDALAAELGMMDDDPPPVHKGYDLGPLVGAIKSVGFDGNIALDYRGGDDGTLGVLQSRDAIEAAILASSE